MIRVSGRREQLFDSPSSDKPKSTFKLPSGDLFLTLVLIVSYLLTRATYEQNKTIIDKTNELIEQTGFNTILGRKPTKDADNRLFKMNNHYKRADKKISDVIFICLLAFFIFKLNWNNTDRFTTEHKLAWGSSVLIAPLIVNLFLEHKDKIKIHPEEVSNIEELKKSNQQTQGFLSIALLLTLAVGLKLAHRILVCKGGMTKPVLIQLIVLGVAVGLYFLANHDLKKHNSITEDTVVEHTGRDDKTNILKKKSVKQHAWVIAFLLILSFTVCKKDTIDYIIEGSLWGYLIQNIARWDYISPDLM